MLSSRTRWDRAVNRLTRLVIEKRRAGSSVLDLTESNPTRVGLPYADDLLAPLADRGGLVYEPAPLGIAEARAAVSLDYERRGLAVGPDRIVLASGTSEAYGHLFKLLCDPGDAVLVPQPSYPLFDFLATLESIEVHRYPLRYDGEWHLAVDELARAVTPRTRAVVLVHPNNPTGSYLKTDEAERLLALCAGAGLALVADEVFADYAFREDRRRVPSLAVDGPALAFALGGLSKSCGLPQLKLAWIAVAGPAAIRDEALARLEFIGDTYLSVGTPVQRAAGSLLARLPELQAPIAHRVRGNRESLRRRLPAGSPATLLDAEGGWYAVLRVPATVPEEERGVGLLANRDVLVHPGFFFDFPTEAYLVVSLLPAPDVFSEGVDRLLRDL
jgi:aspartate/methionine/tyrosine aminotransferase